MEFPGQKSGTEKKLTKNSSKEKYPQIPKLEANDEPQPGPNNFAPCVLLGNEIALLHLLQPFSLSFPELRDTVLLLIKLLVVLKSRLKKFRPLQFSKSSRFPKRYSILLLIGATVWPNTRRAVKTASTRCSAIFIQCMQKWYKSSTIPTGR